MMQWKKKDILKDNGKKAHFFNLIIIKSIIVKQKENPKNAYQNKGKINQIII